MTRRRACSNAMAAKRWKTCSSTSRAGGVTPARRRNDRERRRRQFLRQAHFRHGAALLVSLALVVAAYPCSHLLAVGADADVGVPANMRVAERRWRTVPPRRRRVHRRG